MESGTSTTGGTGTRGPRTIRIFRLDAVHLDLQNKPKFVEIGSQEPEIAFGAGKILLCHIMSYIVGG